MRVALQEDYYTGNDEEDRVIKQQVHDILQIAKWVTSFQ